MNIRGTQKLRTAIIMLTCAACAAGCAARRRIVPAASTADDRLAKAYDLLKGNRTGEAAAVLGALVRDEPADGRARLELAYLDIRLKRWKEAVALLDSAIDADPGNPRLRMERGYARLELGELSAASDEFSSVAREPGEFQEQALTALKGLEGQTTDSARKARVDAILDQGYEDLRKKDNAAARAKFTEALAADPERTEVAKQLGYMSMADGHLAEAARDFAGVHTLAPQDAMTALELGYIYDGLHNEAAAEKSFAAAQTSPDPKIRNAAEAALRNVRAAQRPLFLDLYGSPYYTSRFSNKIAALEANLGWKPRMDWPVSLFIDARYDQDTKSHTGVAPEIFADNAFSVGPGVRLQPQGWNASFTVEEDATWNLTRSAERPRALEADGRVVLTDYHWWDGPKRAFADAGGSVGYYSRYRNNVIGLLQVRAGVKAWDDLTSRVLLYVPVNVLKDGNRDYYNNLGEYGVGVEFQPVKSRNVKLRVEYLRGLSMGISSRDQNPYGRQYSDLRVMLLFSGHFTPPQRADDFDPTRRPSFKW
jgi:Flp pilus assembly protein TadD